MKGHNENAVRLSACVDDARVSLGRLDAGEENVIGAWLAYGSALNEARSLVDSDRLFGEWISNNSLRQVVGVDGSIREINDHERTAAMWAAANADQFEEARQRGNPRTIRGIHAKWKEIEAERAAEAEAAQRQEQASQEAPPEHSGATEADRLEGESHGGREQGPPPEPERSAGQGRAEGSPEGASETGGAAAEGQDASQGDAVPDPYGYAALTEEALLDLANGLRADLDEEKAKRKAAEADVRALRAQLRDFTADDKDEVIRRLQASVRNAENAKWKALEDRDAYHRQLHAVKKERDAAVKEVQGQEVVL